MDWRTNLRPASFRGVPFQVEDAGHITGRRIARHHLPFIDQPIHQDLGRAARGYRIDGFVVGDDYQLQRDRLIEACETKGAGVLVHPYYGDVEVVCESIEVRESLSEGGVARIAMIFGEARERLLVTSEPDPDSESEQASQEVEEAAVDQFEDDLVTEDVPDHSILAGVSAVRAGLDEIEGMALDGPAELVSGFVAEVQAIGDELVAIASKPRAIAQRIGAMIRSIESAFKAPLTAMEALLSLSAINAPLHTGLSYGSQIAQSNAIAGTALISRIAFAEAARAAIAIQHESYEAARQTHDRVREALELQLPGASAPAYSALRQVAALVTTYVPPPAENLPRLLRVTPRATTNALLQAYIWHSEAASFDRIQARNGYLHPGFIPGGQPMELLVDPETFAEAV